MTMSQEVNWWLVHQWVAPALDDAETWPMAGTLEWHELDDEDPRKIAALLDAARHWALRVDSCQQARVEAGEVIAAAAPWRQIAQRQHTAAVWYAEHPWAKRVAS